MRLSHWFRSRKFQPRSLTRVALTRAHLLAPHTSPGSSSVSGHLYFNDKGGEKILCNPPQTPPKSSPDEPSRKKIWVLTYILSEHSFLFLRLKALQSYPVSASNLNLFFNRGSPNFLLTPIFTSSKSPSSPILLAFCYSIGIKNLIRRMQNVRLAMSFAMGTCGDSFVYRTERKSSKAKPQIWRESDAEHLSEPGTELHSSQDPAKSLKKG